MLIFHNCCSFKINYSTAVRAGTSERRKQRNKAGAQPCIYGGIFCGEPKDVPELCGEIDLTFHNSP